MTPLLHLIEPVRWRAALSVGAVRPPSLESAGFVHLSTPQQAHLPAARLSPGRRDLVLLVVDPPADRSGALRTRRPVDAAGGVDADLPLPGT